MEVKLKVITPEAEKTIVEIARVSSSREDKTENPEGLINYLIKHSHWSPFEHAYVTFEIETSKAIGIQLLRHRSFTFQEFSQRYAKVTKFEHIEIRRQATNNRQSSTEVFNPKIMESSMEDKNHLVPIASADSLINNTLNTINYCYNKLLEAGVAKECARMILPMCASTTIYMTGNIRSWIHFLQIRDDAHAQKEIQLIAKEIKKIFIEQLPIISKSLNFNN
jgi:thymidylate synthase (FAD)